jgi:hypothetical protein
VSFLFRLPLLLGTFQLETFVLNHLFVCDPYLPIVEIPDPICAEKKIEI